MDFKINWLDILKIQSRQHPTAKLNCEKKDKTDYLPMLQIQLPWTYAHINKTILYISNTKGENNNDRNISLFLVQVLELSPDGTGWHNDPAANERVKVFERGLTS